MLVTMLQSKLPPSDALLNISGVVQLWGMSDTRHHDKTLPASLAESVAGRLPRSDGARDDAVRIEIVSDRRRSHAPEFRERVVRASYESPLPLREVARQYGIHPSLLFRWRKLAREWRQINGKPSFVPVMMGPAAHSLPADRMGAVGRHGQASLVFPDGVRLEFDTTISGERLREIMAVLRS